jgi:catechol-2,3-dioxygenase
MIHVAIDVDAASVDEALSRLQAAGVHVKSPTDRGYERSIYFRDPNGVRIELLVCLPAPPAQLSQAEIIRRARSLRDALVATFVEDRDVREAIIELQPESPLSRERVAA